MIVLRNGVQIGSAPVEFSGEIERTQAYVMRGPQRWERLALPGDLRFPAGVPNAVAQAGRIRGDQPFGRALASIVQPGTTMLVIPDSLAESLGAAPGPEPLFSGDMVIAQWKMDGAVAGGR